MIIHYFLFLFKTDLMVKMDMDFGANYPDTIQKLALSQGDQAKLPSWTVEGTIIGVQGGTDRVMEILANSSFYDVPVTGIWIQDWSGQIFTDFGDRVFWNWEWNETQVRKDAYLRLYENGSLKMYFSTQHYQKKLKNWDNKGLIS